MNPFAVCCTRCGKRSVTVGEDGVCADCCILAQTSFIQLRDALTKRIESFDCHRNEKDLEDVRSLSARLRAQGVDP